MSLTSDMAALDLELLEELGDDVDFNGTTVRAMFMKGLKEVPVGENVVETREVECWCRESDLPSMTVGDPVVALGGNYRFLAQDLADEAGFCHVRLGT